MEAGDCPTLNMNAMENYLLSQSLKSFCTRVDVSQDGFRLRPHLPGTLQYALDVCKNIEKQQRNKIVTVSK